MKDDPVVVKNAKRNILDRRSIGEREGSQQRHNGLVMLQIDEWTL